MQSRGRLLVLGSVAGLALCLVEALARPGPAPHVERARTHGRLELVPHRMGHRDLRRLPGVGDALGLRILEARRDQADRGERRMRWQDVAGLGPKTEARIQAWLRARGGHAPPPPSRSSGDQLLQE